VTPNERFIASFFPACATVRREIVHSAFHGPGSGDSHSPSSFEYRHLRVLAPATRTDADMFFFGEGLARELHDGRCLCGHAIEMYFKFKSAGVLWL
jgi:hypothetical protein